MSFPRYPSYRDSGLECLGEVPGHWDVTRLKFVATVQTGVAKGKDNSGKSTIEVPYLRVANVQDGYLDLGEISNIELPTDDLARYSLRPGDVLMNEGGDCDKLGRGHIWQGEITPCIHQNHVFAIRPTAIAPEWLNVITGSEYARFYFMSRSKQSTNLASISSTNVMDLPVVIPPAEERAVISIFLDHEISNIDGLMAEQRTLIELLKEKRQAVISHAVTKGLNPDAPMKESGVEWLGKVPEHWEVKRLRFLCDIQTGSKDTIDAVENGDFPFFVRSQTVERIECFSFDCEAVLTAGDGVGVGKVFHYHKGPFDFHQRVYMFNNFQDVSGKFFFCFLKENFFKVALEGGAKSTVDSLRRPLIQNFVITVPPSNEQTVIVEFVEEETTKFDALTAEAQRAIVLLQERRTALISAAVTGKIDVRGWACEAAEIR